MRIAAITLQSREYFPMMLGEQIFVLKNGDTTSKTEDATRQQYFEKNIQQH